MNHFVRQLRTPEERVGMLSNASLPPPTPAADAEEVILRRALEQRDEQAFAQVLDLFYPAMVRLALSHVRTRATADEAIQDTWLAAITGFARFRGRSSIRTWLFRILRNIARGIGRREARSSSFSDLGMHDGGQQWDVSVADTAVAARPALWARDSDPERELLWSELADRLDAAIGMLPPKQREVLLLRDVEGWAAADVCDALRISDSNQRVILHRARDRVRTQLRAVM